MHDTFMRLAIAAGRRSPDAPFGAILVDAATGQVVAEGVNRWRENPTWHGEIDAINRAPAGGPGVRRPDCRVGLAGRGAQNFSGRSTSTSVMKRIIA